MTWNEPIWKLIDAFWSAVYPDDAADWVSYLCYECDFGRDEREVVIDGKATAATVKNVWRWAEESCK